jgi:AcrR family transcriptional regulator
MTTAPRTKNPRGQGDQLRTDLLASAQALLDEGGDPAALTVRGVAKAVGVAPNAVYLHFASRDDLLAEAVAERFATFTDQLRSLATTEADPLTQLRAGHRAYMAFARANPAAYRVVFGGEGAAATERAADDRLSEAAWPAFVELVHILGRCIEAGIFPATTDAAALARLVFTAEHGWSALAGTSRGALLPEPDDIVDTLLALRGR